MRFRKKQPSKYYNDLNISAKLFFDNLGNDDLSFLIISGKPTEKELDEAFDQLYDKYFEKKDDRKARLILKTKAKIVQLGYKITIARNTVAYICTCPLDTAQRNTIIDQIRKVLKINIDAKKDFVDEVHRVLTVQIASWETNLKIEQHNYKELRKGKIQTFESTLDAINDSKGYKALDETTTLLFYMEAERREIEKNKEKKKQQNANKRRR